MGRQTPKEPQSPGVAARKRAEGRFTKSSSSETVIRDPAQTTQ